MHLPVSDTVPVCAGCLPVVSCRDWPPPAGRGGHCNREYSQAEAYSRLHCTVLVASQGKAVLALLILFHITCTCGDGEVANRRPGSLHTYRSYTMVAWLFVASTPSGLAAPRGNPCRLVTSDILASWLLLYLQPSDQPDPNTAKLYDKPFSVYQVGEALAKPPTESAEAAALKEPEKQAKIAKEAAVRKAIEAAEVSCQSVTQWHA